MAEKIDEIERRYGAHLLKFARDFGWKDDGEGPLEFLLRRSREIAIEDCGPDLSFELRAIRGRMVKHYNECNTYEMGYSTSLGSLWGFIREIDECLSSKT